MAHRIKKVMTQPINLIFRFLQQKSRIQIWIYDQKHVRMEGVVVGFDEYMNIVLDDAYELNLKAKTRRALGRALLKGDNICLIMKVGDAPAS